MIWTSLALGLWIILGGFISYYGDLQGRRWGKKKVFLKTRWFTLRPKYTAVLITSLTGGFIALLSIVTLLLIAPDIRNVVLRGESAIRENKRLIAEQSKERLQNQHDREISAAESKKQHALQIQQAKQDQQELDKKQVQLDQKQLQLGQKQLQLQQLQAKIQPLTDSVKTLQATRNALQAKITQYKRDIMQYKQEIALKRQENDNVAAINIALNSLNAKLKAENQDLDKKNQTLQAANTELEKTKKGLTDDNEEFYQKNVALQKEISDKTQEVAQLNQKVDSLNQESDEAQMHLRQSKQLLTKLADMYSVVRQGHVQLRAGVEMSRQEMDAHLRPEAVKKQLQAMMDRAVTVAKAYGAAQDSDGPAARLLPQKKITLTGTEEAGDNSQIESLAQQWSGSDVSFVVVASTVTNCLEGEPVYLQLHFYPVRRVYSKGAVVATRQIDAHESVEKIINDLFAFLQKDVQQAALRDGIIPKIDPETGQSEVGVAGMADLVGIFERVRRMHGQVLLTAKAKQDISSADAVHLTFHVERVKVVQPQAGLAP